ncbi:ribosome biogenesis regulatory protein [Rhizoctonia solani]|uniref:Ribosome biogenesis regulatory protein n=1 Tax=Rhizoctonia solani TaxID=456999 RepID=A0A8H8NM62_9AGAM|nr:ribosome biogenesis regulatory protein [Rhizoctonia solani]QRW16249.1 ribosome biogenesis regulatory protein [Rhizoctonia solani]
MDVSAIVEAEASKKKAVTVEKDIPIQIDIGLLSALDTNPIDTEAYNTDLESHLQAVARDGAQVILGALFGLPTQPSDDGPIATLPPPTTALPRAKPLPKPKPPTKWERFAAAKGIQKTKRDRREWDEERQEWVNRWGWKGKNKDQEEQWIHEVPDNAPDDYDPAVEARKERKARVAKNEKQRERNLNVAAASGQLTRTSTASMGRFDKKLEGDTKLKGVKRQYAPNEVSAESEKKSSMDIIKRLDREPPKSKRVRTDAEAEDSRRSGKDGLVNVRKAIRHASKGNGGIALAKGLKKQSGTTKRKAGKGK